MLIGTLGSVKVERELHCTYANCLSDSSLFWVVQAVCKLLSLAFCIV